MFSIPTELLWLSFIWYACVFLNHEYAVLYFCLHMLIKFHFHGNGCFCISTLPCVCHLCQTYSGLGASRKSKCPRIKTSVHFGLAKMHHLHNISSNQNKQIYYNKKYQAITYLRYIFIFIIVTEHSTLQCYF